MLRITSDGRKLGLDQRIINPNLPDEPTSKVNICVDNIHRIWEEGHDNKLTQLVFCDIVNYSKTRDVYAAHRKSGYSKKFLEKHEADIIIHKAAKKAFDEMGVKKLPTFKSLQVESADLLTAKKEAYFELKMIRNELRELLIHKANYEELRDLEKREERKEKERDRE